MRGQLRTMNRNIGQWKINGTWSGCSLDNDAMKSSMKLLLMIE